MIIKILEITGTAIKFDIIGMGNVLMDYSIGDFDCASFKDTEIDDEIFRQYILDNIDEIISILKQPSYEKVIKEVDAISTINLEDDFEMVDGVKETIESWIVSSLPILIKNEDYERCSILNKFKDKLNNLNK